MIRVYSLPDGTFSSDEEEEEEEDEEDEEEEGEIHVMTARLQVASLKSSITH